MLIIVFRNQGPLVARTLQNVPRVIENEKNNGKKGKCGFKHFHSLTVIGKD